MTEETTTPEGAVELEPKTDPEVAAAAPSTNGTSEHAPKKGQRRKRQEDEGAGDEARMTVEPVMITAEMARHWLETRRPDFQRPLRQWHVDELVEALRAGEVAVRSIKFANLHGLHLLMDGQHMLHAIAASGIPIELPVITFRVDTMEQAEADYTNTDRPVVRTFADAGRAHNISERTGMNTPEINAVAGAVKVIMDGFVSSTLRMNRADLRSVENRVKAILEWHRDARKAFAAISEGTNSVVQAIKGQSVFSVALVTFRHEGGKAAGFWNRVAAGENLTKGLPEHTLREHLMEMKGRRTTVNLLSRQVAEAWNASWDGRTLSSKEIAKIDPSRPIRIEGTPYDGTHVIRPQF